MVLTDAIKWTPDKTNQQVAVCLWVTLFLAAMNSASFGHHNKCLLPIPCECVTSRPSSTGDSDKSKHEGTPRSAWCEEVLLGFVVSPWDYFSLLQAVNSLEGQRVSLKRGKFNFDTFFWSWCHHYSPLEFGNRIRTVPKLLFEDKIPADCRLPEDKDFISQAGWRASCPDKVSVLVDTVFWVECRDYRSSKP